MLGYSFNDPGLAGAADTLRAGVARGYSGIQECVQDGLARLNRDRSVAPRELHLKAPLGRRLLLRLEVFDVHVVT